MKRSQLIDMRKRQRLTQSDVACKAGIHRSYYGLIENGVRNPALKVAIAISEALNVSIQTLFPDDIFFANRCYVTKLK